MGCRSGGRVRMGRVMAGRFSRRIIVASLISLAGGSLALSPPSVAAGDEPLAADAPGTPGLGGQEAIDALGDTIDAAAARLGMTADELRELLLTDPTARIGATGSLFFVDPGTDGGGGGAGLPLEAPFPYGETFTLHSNPGSSKVIYLDFDGYTSAEPSNFFPAAPHTYEPWDADGNPGSFSNSEMDAIQDIWLRVSEDYAPFDVDVTTEDPGAAAINRADEADTNYGTRTVITEDQDGLCECGGLAAFGFDDFADHEFLQPALVFASALGPDNAKFIAEAASHETGHTLFLDHDGVNPATGYYEGHGAWAPIMGTGYDRPVVQFSKGEYAGANNLEDDLAILNSHGLAFRADEAGSTYATATTLAGSGVVNQAGIITNAADIDAFKFTTSAGPVNVTANPAGVSPNLDIKLTLVDSAGGVVATNDPAVAFVDDDHASGLDATISTTVAAGSYALLVEGVGTGNPNTGYSDYASIGRYTITGTYGGSTTTTGVFRPSNGNVYLKNTNASGFADTQFVYGIAADVPVAGDWDGNGVDSVGIYRDGTFYLRNSNTAGSADVIVSFGAAGDKPVVGDWDGNGTDTIGVYRNGTFLLRNTNTPGNADLTFEVGTTGDLPIAGDWNGDGTDTAGVFRPSNGFIYLKNANTPGFADIEFVYGQAGDAPVAGDWDGDGTDSVGIYRGAQFYLRNSNTPGFAELVFALGAAGDVPIAGRWI